MTYSTSVQLDDETKALLDDVAQFRDQSPHWIMQKAIEKYLNEESAEMRYFREGVEGLEAAKRSGQFSTLNDMKSWIDQLDSPDAYDQPHTRHITL